MCVYIERRYGTQNVRNLTWNLGFRKEIVRVRENGNEQGEGAGIHQSRGGFQVFFLLDIIRIYLYFILD
jgi:hypothetical protein